MKPPGGSQFRDSGKERKKVKLSQRDLTHSFTGTSNQPGRLCGMMLREAGEAMGDAEGGWGGCVAVLLMLREAVGDFAGEAVVG